MKRLLSLFLLMSMVSFCPAFAEVTVGSDKTPQPVIEHLKDGKGQIDVVRVFNDKIVLSEGVIFNIAFAQEFTTKGLKVDDKVNFIIKEQLQTKEGRLILPAETQIIATVKSLEPKKSFNRNAKLLLSMGEIVLPNGQTGTISASVNKKNGILFS